MKGNSMGRRTFALTAIGTALATAGCVNVRAPDKPIEINLNVNVRQEVVVRLQRDVEELIKRNPEDF